MTNTTELKKERTKITVGAIIFLLSYLIAIAAFIVTLYSNQFAGYQMENLATIIMWAILSFICGAAFIVLSYIFPHKHAWLGLIAVVYILFIGFTIRAILLGKQPVFGSVIFSDLEKGVPNAEASAYSGMAALVIYLVAGVIAVVGSFFQIFKKETVQEEIPVAAEK